MYVRKKKKTKKTCVPRLKRIKIPTDRCVTVSPDNEIIPGLPGLSLQNTSSMCRRRVPRVRALSKQTLSNDTKYCRVVTLEHPACTCKNESREPNRGCLIQLLLLNDAAYASTNNYSYLNRPDIQREC